MITQQFKIMCNALSAFASFGESTVCNTAQTRDEASVFHATRAFQREGWYVADDSRTYCPTHADKARQIDLDARSKARSS